MSKLIQLMQKHFGDQEQIFLMWFRPYIYISAHAQFQNKKKTKKIHK